jgi:hypothetical protein
MPESRHTRGGRRRTRPQRQRAPEQRPAASPRWVGATGLGLVGGGALVLLLGNLPVIADATRRLPLLGSNWTLVAGIVSVSLGFVFLMRWR